MECNHLHRLSAELITSILLELPTVQSLYSLIRASAKSYQVFLASKEKILVSLMLRTIAPTTFIDALAAVQASQLKEIGPDRRTVLAFLRSYENKRHRVVQHKHQRFSPGTAVSLCQLHRSTQDFIKDLTSRSNFYLRRCRDSIILRKSGSGCLCRSDGEHIVDRDDRYAPLSLAEEVRLQRAFYRYELYTQIFSSDMTASGEELWELPSDSYFFLENYQHWEVEELACVDNYLWSLLSNTFDCIESSFVGIELQRPPLDDPSSIDPQAYHRLMAQNEAKFEIHSLYPDYLLSLSLPFLHHALQLGRLNMQQEMSSHIHYTGQGRSLSTALEGLWKSLSRLGSELIQNYNCAVALGNFVEFNDTSDGPNEAWLCVYGNAQTIAPNAIRHTTQSLAYVFWDSQRLRRAGFVHPWMADISRCEIKMNTFPSRGMPRRQVD